MPKPGVYVDRVRGVLGWDKFWTNSERDPRISGQLISHLALQSPAASYLQGLLLNYSDIFQSIISLKVGRTVSFENYKTNIIPPASSQK